MNKLTSSVSESITRDLALRIIRGELGVGMPIPGENELAQQYDASRTSVRNALQVLGAKGMLLIQAKRRSTVTPREQWSFLDAEVLSWLEDVGIESELVEQLMLTRLIFEPDVAAMAALNASGHDLAAIEGALETMQSGQKNNSAAQFESGDLAFHTAVLRACHNPFLASVGNALSAAMLLSFKQTLEDDLQLTQEAVLQHRDLLEAIRLKQPDAARQCMRNLLLSAAHKHIWREIPEKYQHFF
ncbi:FadR/GntR family transcriptional regulator [Rahnella bruchi]|uniref:FadR/GntR family transcriptional regulator n=1 Tax=Rahnella bruchi TaxID=1510573 RepID=UPI000EA3BD31|nr:FadR/GntR family transcriptional regulator [Rahnella bruchi]